MKETELEDEFNIQRQLLYFHPVVKQLQAKGFTFNDCGCYDVALIYRSSTEEVEVEFLEYEGRITVHVHECLYEDDFQSNCFWKEPTRNCKMEELTQKVNNAFFISSLKLDVG